MPSIDLTAAQLDLLFKGLTHTYIEGKLDATEDAFEELHNLLVDARSSHLSLVETPVPAAGQRWEYVKSGHPAEADVDLSPVTLLRPGERAGEWYGRSDDGVEVWIRREQFEAGRYRRIDSDDSKRGS